MKILTLLFTAGLVIIILGVSLAFARATALSKKIELYEYLGELAENNDFKIPPDVKPSGITPAVSSPRKKQCF